MMMATPEKTLNAAILNDIPVTVEINGINVQEIKSGDICPWYEPPKPKKSWRRRITQRKNGNQQ